MTSEPLDVISMPISDKVKWAGGIVNFDPNIDKIIARQEPYSFFEIDSTNPDHHELVLSAYKKFNIDLVSQRIGKGYHYFGGMVDRNIWKDWYVMVKNLNVKYPPLTLRVTKKFKDEVFERPIYHEAQNVVPKWSQALMHFLNKEMRGENSTDIHKAMNRCSLNAYFKCVVYKILLK